jgi:flagellar biosynthesis anti-sigma factor FlgM
MAIQIRGFPGGAIKSAGDSNQVATRGPRDANAVAPRPLSKDQSDRISITGSASRLQALEARIRELPVVDMFRVETTRLALATGSLHIEPMSIAGKILNMERELL